jgi:hypothetical protein
MNDIRKSPPSSPCAAATLLIPLILLGACAALKPVPCPEEDPVDLAEALDLAWKSEMAYQPDSAILGACGIDQCFVVTGTATGARAYVQRDDENGMQWAAFRGTKTLADARLDGRYLHTRCRIWTQLWFIG